MSDLLCVHVFYLLYIPVRAHEMRLTYEVNQPTSTYLCTAVRGLVLLTGRVFTQVCSTGWKFLSRRNKSRTRKIFGSQPRSAEHRGRSADASQVADRSRIFSPEILRLRVYNYGEVFAAAHTYSIYVGAAYARMTYIMITDDVLTCRSYRASRTGLSLYTLATHEFVEHNKRQPAVRHARQSPACSFAKADLRVLVLGKLRTGPRDIKFSKRNLWLPITGIARFEWARVQRFQKGPSSLLRSLSVVRTENSHFLVNLKPTKAKYPARVQHDTEIMHAVVFIPLLTFSSSALFSSFLPFLSALYPHLLPFPLEVNPLNRAGSVGNMSL